MRIAASVCLAFAILLMLGCGTSAEDKKLITDQGAQITALDKKVGDMDKAFGELSKKVDVIWNHLAANPIGKAKFPPEEKPAEVKPTEKPAEKPGAVKPKTEPKKEETKKEEPKAKEPGKTK